jgi:hypothetical protein
MRALLAFALLLAGAAAAPAQTAGRFQMEKTGEGFVRLDTQIGSVSACREENGEFVCRMAADERAAMDEETARLRTELERLEARVAALEKSKSALPLPTDGDVDRALGVAERLLRGFMGIARELEAEGGPAPPDRT